MPRLLLIVVGLLGLCSLAAVADEAPGSPGFEVMFDVGAALPLGDLGAAFGTPSGLDQQPGYRLGLRTRWITRPGWTISPSFTFTEFGGHDGLDDQTGKTRGEGQKFKVNAGSLRYGLDVGYLAPGPDESWRGFVVLGVAAAQNRYKEELVDDEVFYEDSIDTLAWMASVGARRGGVELAFEYHGSHFDTGRFFRDLTYYNWNYVALRLGYALPRY